MSSTYSTNLAIELMGNGDQAGNWGSTTNTNLGTLIEQAISGYVTQAVATGTDTVITIPNGASGVARLVVQPALVDERLVITHTILERLLEKVEIRPLVLGRS